MRNQISYWTLGSLFENFIQVEGDSKRDKIVSI